MPVLGNRLPALERQVQELEERLRRLEGSSPLSQGTLPPGVGDKRFIPLKKAVELCHYG